MPTQFKYERQVWILGSVASALVFVYLLLVGTTVYNTLGRQRAEREIAEVTSKLSEMEFSYLNLKAKVNLELAREMGFVETDNVIVAKKENNTTAFVPKERM